MEGDLLRCDICGKPHATTDGVCYTCSVRIKEERVTIDVYGNVYIPGGYLFQKR